MWTLFSVLLLVVLTGLGWGCQATAIFLFCRLIKIADITWRKIALLFLKIIGITIPFVILERYLMGKANDVNPYQPLIVFGIVQIALLMVVFSMIRSHLATSKFKAFLTLLVSLLSGVLFALLPALFLKEFVIEAYVTPTNSMAPTILGIHVEEPCPRCGAPAYGRVLDEYERLSDGLLICSRDYRSCPMKTRDGQSLGCDRIIVNKRMTPQRWDLVAFRYPEDESVNYLKRLVGLPGETVIIRDGAVWVNGEKLTPPAPYENLHYVTKLEGMPPWILWGTEIRPAVLGPDEYFVLGDFSDRAKDSRMWLKGVPGHPPYAVPKSHMIGVVTTTYWPPARWRAFH